MQKESVNIDCTGYQIAADWYEQEGDRALLVLPGFTSNKKNYEQLVEATLSEVETSTLVIDYSGHGESPFDIEDITIAENFSEVVRAYDWIRDNHPQKKIDVLGTSYGGYFAAKLSTVRSISKLVLRVPANYDPKDEFTPWRNMDREKIRNEFRADPKNFKSHPVLAYGSEFEGQTYVLTHELDEACPKTSTDPYIKAFRAKTWEAKGFKHSVSVTNPSPEQMRAYQKVLITWLNE